MPTTEIDKVYEAPVTAAFQIIEACGPPPEVLARAIALLYAALEYVQKAKWLEQEFYPLSYGNTLVLVEGQWVPSADSPEVRLLIAADLVEHKTVWGTNPDIPCDSLRITHARRIVAWHVIEKYTDRITTVNVIS